MPARRGEVPFVAVPVGQADDEKEVLGLAADLKIHRAQALGYWVMWKELMLRRGDAKRGVLKDYEANHIAARLGHSNVPKLVAALKRAGLLTTQRKTFRDPTWAESITGHYAAKKAEDRDTWARQKKAQRDAAAASALGSGGADVHPMSTWTGGGHPPDVQVENGQKERKESTGLPPQPPAKTRVELASQRWEWVLRNHHRPMNPEGCKVRLGKLSDDDWALFQWVAGLPPDGGPYKLSRKKRVLGQDSHKILTTSGFLQFRREWVEKLRQEKRTKNGQGPKFLPPVDDGAETAARLAAASKYVMDMLEDPDRDERLKDAAKARFRQAYPEVTPPWEVS